MSARTRARARCSPPSLANGRISISLRRPTWNAVPSTEVKWFKAIHPSICLVVVTSISGRTLSLRNVYWRDRNDSNYVLLINMSFFSVRVTITTLTSISGQNILKKLDISCLLHCYIKRLRETRISRCGRAMSCRSTVRVQYKLLITWKIVHFTINFDRLVCQIG